MIIVFDKFNESLNNALLPGRGDNKNCHEVLYSTVDVYLCIFPSFEGDK